MSLFRCPICAQPLQKRDRAYRCGKGHSYDCAKEGYVHLLPANQKHSKNPGDDKDMAASRNRFLSGNWYQSLRSVLEELTCQTPGKQLSVLDSGCGEGYYTAALKKALSDHGINAEIYAIDVSKDAVMLA